jgi:predicted phosphoribosyltransferase
MPPFQQHSSGDATAGLPYRDRTEAGRVLVRTLQQRVPDVTGDDQVLALPRGGVPVACEVAAALEQPLDVFVVRKLGLPGQEELAMGAIAGGGIQVINRDLVRAAGVSAGHVQRIIDRETRELERRERTYRGDRPAPDLRDRTVILVDDGLATGSTMQAAALAVHERHPARILVAVPVAPPDAVAMLEQHCDAVICPARPEPFGGVGRWYARFDQLGDDAVRELLERAWSGAA